MNILTIKRSLIIASSVVTLGAPAMAFASASALGSQDGTTTGSTTGKTAQASANTAAQQQRMTLIKTRGDQEIARRLTALNTLSGKINSAVKLSASDKATLTTEVNNEITALTTLKTKLDGDTTLADAKADAQSIVSDYRVYVLVLPKVMLVKVADDQQVVETKLNELMTKFTTRINAAKSQGKEVTALQTALTDMQNQVNASQAISSGIEAKVIGLQPSDYNSDHSILSGDRDQLKTAHADNQKAISDAKTIISDLKNL